MKSKSDDRLRWDPRWQPLHGYASERRNDRRINWIFGLIMTALLLQIFGTVVAFIFGKPF